MKTSYRSAGEKQPITVAMTPMIDVVFLLLIFFVCTSSFQPVEESLPSDLVLSGAGRIDAPTEETPELEEIVVRGVREAGATRWAVNDSPCESIDGVDALLAALAEIDPGLPVIVDADGPTPIGEVISVYDAGRRAGFASVRFAASAE